MMDAVFWDVDHGSAAYFKINDKIIIIDLGAGSYVDSDFSPLIHLKSKYKINEIHYLIITHPHRDHLDDIENLKYFKVRNIIRPTHLTERDIVAGNKSDDFYLIKKYLELNKRCPNPLSATSKYMQIPIENGVIQIFSPNLSPVNNLNNHSLVTIITFLGKKVLIPGDNENNSWIELLKNPIFRKSITGTNIFVAPHHGRESGICKALFDVISPNLTILSDESYVNTTASSFYSSVSKGLPVRYRNTNGVYEKRYCVTTRSDGAIKLQIGKTTANQVMMNVVAG